MFNKCDSNCSARATQKLINSNGDELVFCTHHFNQNSRSLKAQGWTNGTGEAEVVQMKYLDKLSEGLKDVFDHYCDRWGVTIEMVDLYIYDEFKKHEHWDKITDWDTSLKALNAYTEICLGRIEKFTQGEINMICFKVKRLNLKRTEDF